LTDTSGYKWIHKSHRIHICIPSGVNAEDQHLYPDTFMYPLRCKRAIRSPSWFRGGGTEGERQREGNRYIPVLLSLYFEPWL